MNYCITMPDKQSPNHHETHANRTYIYIYTHQITNRVFQNHQARIPFPTDPGPNPQRVKLDP